MRRGTNVSGAEFESGVKGHGGCDAAAPLNLILFCRTITEFIYLPDGISTEGIQQM